MISNNRSTTEIFNVHWLARAVTAGFFATVAMTFVLLVAYAAAVAIASDVGAGELAGWAAALARNPLTAAVGANLLVAVLLHFCAGIVWAVLYAFVAEPRLPGAGWRRGLTFSLVPWLLSVLVFLPAIGAGFLGLDLGAGPLPIIGNLILHVIYGVTLGHLYLVETDRPLTDREEAPGENESSVLANAGRVMAFGIVVGLALGALMGLIVGAAFFPALGPWLGLVAGAVFGSALGILAGSIFGLTPGGQ